MSVQIKTISKAVSLGVIATAISITASPAFSKQCIHGMAYTPHYMPYGKHHGYGAKWGHGFMHGYGPMHGHSNHAQKNGYGRNTVNMQSSTQPTELDLIDTAVAAGDFTTLVKALDAAGMKDLLKGEGPFTVFAPTDEAFAKLPQGELDELLINKEKLVDVLKYHVVSREIKAVDVLQTRELKTAGGKTLPVESLEVTKADIETSNGTIHIIDSVLVPTM